MEKIDKRPPEYTDDELKNLFNDLVEKEEDKKHSGSQNSSDDQSIENNFDINSFHDLYQSEMDMQYKMTFEKTTSLIL